MDVIGDDEILSLSSLVFVWVGTQRFWPSLMPHFFTKSFNIFTMSTPGSVLLAPSAKSNYDLMYYLKGAAAGGICCSITHGALTPVDVVKTRVQLDPVKVSDCIGL